MPHANPVLPTTMGIDLPVGRHASREVARSYRCSRPSTAFQSGVVTTISCVEPTRGFDSSVRICPLHVETASARVTQRRAGWDLTNPSLDSA